MYIFTYTCIKQTGNEARVLPHEKSNRVSFVNDSATLIQIYFPIAATKYDRGFEFFRKSSGKLKKKKNKKQANIHRRKRINYRLTTEIFCEKNIKTKDENKIK